MKYSEYTAWIFISAHSQLQIFIPSNRNIQKTAISNKLLAAVAYCIRSLFCFDPLKVCNWLWAEIKIHVKLWQNKSDQTFVVMLRLFYFAAAAGSWYQFKKNTRKKQASQQKIGPSYFDMALGSFVFPRFSSHSEFVRFDCLNRKWWLFYFQHLQALFRIAVSYLLETLACPP